MREEKEKGGATRPVFIMFLQGHAMACPYDFGGQSLTVDM
jgi:hypothetical protein